MASVLQYAYDGYVAVGRGRSHSHDVGMKVAGALDELFAERTQQVVAAYLSETVGLIVDQSKVSRWLRGQVPTWDELEAVERAFGKPRGWLYHRAGLVDAAALITAGDDDDHTTAQLEAELAAVLARAGQLRRKLAQSQTSAKRADLGRCRERPTD